jgi:hypothetical protein
MEKRNQIKNGVEILNQREILIDMSYPTYPGLYIDFEWKISFVMIPEDPAFSIGVWLILLK